VFVVFGMLCAAPLAAQSSTPDSELKQLIPDAAVADPETWARGTPSSAVTSDLKPDSPMSDLPEITVAWPDTGLALPELASLPPEPDLAALLPPATGVPSAELAMGAADAQPGRGKLANLHDAVARGRLRLNYSVGAAGFPEHADFENRFRALSTVATLPSKEQNNIGQLAVRAATDSALLLQLLRTYGYYEGEVLQSISGSAPSAGASGGPVVNGPQAGITVAFDIVPGARYRFGAVELGHLADTAADYPALRNSLEITSGDPLYADAIVKGRAGLDAALGESGYPFSKIDDPSLLVDHRREAGDLTMLVTPGGKYRFAGVNSTNPRFLSSRHLAQIARFKPGEVWQRSQVTDFRQAILATGLVASVTVTPQETKAPTASEPGDVMLDVALSKAPQRTISAAVGYDTAAGFRLETSWENRNLFPPEGLLRLRAVAGTDEQLAGVTFRRNNFRGRDRVLTFDVYADNANLSAYAARKLDFTASYERLSTLIFQKPWTWSVGLEVAASAEREGVPSGITLGMTTATPARINYLTAALPLRAAYDASNSLLDPTRGWRASLRISPEVAAAHGQTSPYVITQFDLSGYRPVAAGVVLAGRLRLGGSFGTALTNIAPSRRFYAGGGASIRGFGFDLVGPRDSTNGAYVGGRSLYEFSLEARLHTGLFGGALSLVPFLDGGGVDTGPVPGFADVRYGAGLGLRYQTGFGPLRIDVGTPLGRRPGEAPVGVYVALGQSF
jgi:translocation and assembly module TamA